MALAQTASSITPDELKPQLQRLGGSIVFTGQSGTQAPAGSQAIGITLSGVTLQDGLPQLAAENEAFEARLTRGRIPVSELFDATADLEAAYAQAGFVLSRVVLPQQTLRDGGRLRVVVVNGFIEDIDTTNVPERVRKRVEGLTSTLIDKPGLTRAELERQLLLAGDVPGTALKSALAAGKRKGGAVIALEPDFQPITGFAGFSNPTGSELGRFALNLGVEFNAPFSFGETLYARLTGSPKDMFANNAQSRIIALGAVVPIGFSGLTFNVEATSSRTTPESNAAPTRSKFDRQSLRLLYPFVRTRQRNLTGQLSLDLQQDSQGAIVAGGTTPLYRDKLAVLRLGGTFSLFHENNSVTEGGVFLSQGLDSFGARSAADAAGTGTPLSRVGADVDFTKLVGSISHRRALSENLALSFSGRLQTSFGDAMLVSEQFSIVGPQELSAFDSGDLRGDSGWVVRSELSTQMQANVGATPLLVSPYAFVGFGAVKLERPTAAEQRRTEALVYGIGVDLFTQTESNFRSSSLRIELGRGERDDAIPDDTRISIAGNFRF